MKAQTNQRGGFPSVVAQAPGQQRDRERKAHVVAEHMMVVRPPGQWVRGVASAQFGHEAKTIDVRNDAGDRDQTAITAVEASRVGHHPADEQVRDWTHL